MLSRSDPRPSVFSASPHFGLPLPPPFPLSPVFLPSQATITPFSDFLAPLPSECSALLPSLPCHPSPHVAPSAPPPRAFSRTAPPLSSPALGLAGPLTVCWSAPPSKLAEAIVGDVDPHKVHLPCSLPLPNPAGSADVTGPSLLCTRSGQWQSATSAHGTSPRRVPRPAARQQGELLRLIEHGWHQAEPPASPCKAGSPLGAPAGPSQGGGELWWRSDAGPLVMDGYYHSRPPECSDYGVVRPAFPDALPSLHPLCPSS